MNLQIVDSVEISQTGPSSSGSVVLPERLLTWLAYRMAWLAKVGPAREMRGRAAVSLCQSNP
jgi:hypothetical protein